MSQGHRFLEELAERVLVGDGAIGTVLFARGAEPGAGVERLNTLAPDLVLALHRDYVAAGSRVIETNTFGANLASLARYGINSEKGAREVITQGVRLAREAAAADTFVAGSIGPLPDLEGEPLGATERTAMFAAQIIALADAGADLLLFESFPTLDALASAVRIARSLADLPIVAQAAFDSELRTSDGADAAEVVRACTEAGADVVGANCGYGLISAAKSAKNMLSQGAPTSAYLNAGFPERIEGRPMYVPNDEYVVQTAVELVDSGVKLVGGCCGTDPGTIRLLVSALAGHTKTRVSVVTSQRSAPTQRATEPETPTIPGPILVELDGPRTLDPSRVIAAARVVKEAGASAVTIGDNPLASVRVENIAVAGIVHREVGIPVIPHLTGRDRNRLGLQSAIMGAHMLGLRALLCLTGDPVRMCQDPNTSGVFDLTSVGLVRMVSEFNSGHRLSSDCRTAFAIGVAANPNVRTTSGQIDKLRRKIEAGAQFALTQPVFDPERFEAFLESIAEAKIDLPIYVGIMPLLSARSAEFLHNEVPGILVPDEIRSRLASFETVEDQRAAGTEIAGKLVERLAGLVRGFYLVCPRNHAELVTPLIGIAKERMGI